MSRILCLWVYIMHYLRCFLRYTCVYCVVVLACTVLPSSHKKTNVTYLSTMNLDKPNATHSNTVNLDRCISRFLLLEYVIPGTMLVFHGKEEIYMYYILLPSHSRCDNASPMNIHLKSLILWDEWMYYVLCFLLWYSNDQLLSIHRQLDGCGLCKAIWRFLDLGTKF